LGKNIGIAISMVTEGERSMNIRCALGFASTTGAEGIRARGSRGSQCRRVRGGFSNSQPEDALGNLCTSLQAASFLNKL
jgi:hypothetical protein